METTVKLGQFEQGGMYINSVIKDKSMICFVYTASSQQFIVNVPDDKELYNDFKTRQLIPVVLPA